MSEDVEMTQVRKDEVKSESKNESPNGWNTDDDDEMEIATNPDERLRINKC